MRKSFLLVVLTIWALTASVAAFWLRRDGLETAAEGKALAERLDDACHRIQHEFEHIHKMLSSTRPHDERLRPVVVPDARRRTDSLVFLSQGCLPENLNGAPHTDIVGLIMLDTTSKAQVDAAARHLAAWAGWYAQAFEQARKAGWHTHDWTAYFVSRGR